MSTGHENLRNLDNNQQNQLFMISNELDRLSNSIQDTDPLKNELNRMRDELTQVQTTDQFDKYLKSLEWSKVKEIIDLCETIIHKDLSDLKRQISQSSKVPAVSMPELNTQEWYSAVAEKWRKVSRQRVETIISSAESKWWLIWWIVWWLKNRA